MGFFSWRLVFLLVLIVSLVGCSVERFPRPDVKNDFCGVHIDRQYCKCAFHGEYCDNIGLSKREANAHVTALFDAWVDERLQEWLAVCLVSGGIPDGDVCSRKYGVVERDGVLYLNSRPGEVLSLRSEDLPVWARGQIATVGATIATVGPPDMVVSGDDMVFLNGLPVARVNDSTAQGGVIVEGSSNIFVNGRAVAIIGGMAVSPMVTGVVPLVGGPITGNPN